MKLLNFIITSFFTFTIYGDYYLNSNSVNALEYPAIGGYKTRSKTLIIKNIRRRARIFSCCRSDDNSCGKELTTTTTIETLGTETESVETEEEIASESETSSSTIIDSTTSTLPPSTTTVMETTTTTTELTTTTIPVTTISVTEELTTTQQITSEITTTVTSTTVAKTTHIESSIQSPTTAAITTTRPTQTTTTGRTQTATTRPTQTTTTGLTQSTKTVKTTTRCPTCPSRKFTCTTDKTKFSKDQLVTPDTLGTWATGCGKKYVLIKKKKLNQYEAEAMCCSIGMRLIELPRRNDSDCLNTINTVTFEYNDPIWTAARSDLRCSLPDRFAWCESTVLQFPLNSLWKPDQPNNYGGDQFCMLYELSRTGTNYGIMGYNDWKCTDDFAYICEKPK